MSFTILILALSVVGTSSSGVNVTGNPTWDGLLSKCWKRASFTCVQDGLRETIEDTLEGDIAITESINFVKNENKYSFESNAVYDEEEDFAAFVNAVEDSEALHEKRRPKLILEPRSVDGITDILYNKGVHYLMTHTLDLQLPEAGFGGGKIKIEPKSIEEDGGVLIKVKFDDPPKPEGRIFLKKMKQAFKKKLMSSFMAALLVIKLIKVKLMFLLPIIVGVGTAKKILLKVLLFLFPALTHLFKLCAYYHHHHSKYHLHHHHQIAHHHHHSKPIYIAPPPVEYDYPPPGGEIIHRSEPNNELSSWGIEYEEPKHEDHVNRVYSVNLPNKPDQQAVYVPYTGHKPYTQPQHQLPEDPFYSPILYKLDRVFTELGFTDEPCKERLVCSMYKTPERFSPHSNLVSAEISRDPSELQKPLYANTAVVRYFRYVQAARNGQDMKDCLALYPSCSLLTE
ncbi:uncharacterized protein LOC106662385 [Cimex lectularius]|uniref:Uncharacterized protein n=1 Tax=Cimex lectularius TaxID=79782 RepID=A0A8I6RDR3_CIMLE|nr:uncharacterized protein LOC106662385 [Cimex lectularius]